MARLDVGDLAGAHRALASLVAPDSHALGSCLWHFARAELLLEEGRAEEAVRAGELVRDLSSWARAPVGMWWHVPVALGLDRLGRTAEAIDVAEAWVQAAAAWGSPSAHGAALRALGRLRRAEGLELLEASVAVLEGTPARFQLARSYLALGAALRRARRPSVARGPLRQGLDLARACGSARLEAIARTELGATGAREAPGEAGGVEALTPSERRVVELAVAGRRNREIAQELYVTPKTVEVHLSNAYRKLGVAGRRDLAGALVG
jgi:DNA-binding CsgD family transcriptional regulator